MSAPPELVLGGGSLVNQVGRALRTALDTELAPHGITSQQAAALLVATKDEVSPNQLVPLLGTDTAGVTRLLDRLEAKDLVRRRPAAGDRRSVVVEPTAAGRGLAPQLTPAFGRVTRRLLDGFSADDLERVTAALQRMLANLRGGTPPERGAARPPADGR